MIRGFRSAATLVALACVTSIAGAATSPVFPDETLNYVINWPSGLTLGEAHWAAHNAGSAQAPVWQLDLTFDARIPGFALTNAYHAVTANYCTDQLTRNIQHGSVKTSESETVDPKNLTVTRTTTLPEGGGTSTFTVPDCVRDALTFLLFTRHELAAGRIPPNQTVLLGSKYDLRLTYLGLGKVTVGNSPVDAERLGCDVVGPSARLSVEVDFARDSVRTPVLIKIPLAMGTFSLELAR